MPANKPTACGQLNIDLRKELRKLARQLCHSYGCSPRDPLWSLVKDIPESDSSLSRLSDEAVATSDVTRYTLVSQIRALYSKNPAFAGASCEEKCLESFYLAERMNVRTNRRIALTVRGRIGSKYYQILENARAYIRHVIGTKPTMWVELCKHGNGSSIGCNGKFTAPVFKMGAFPYSVTSSCSTWLSYLIDSSPIWSDIVNPHPRVHDSVLKLLNIVPSANKFSFVPKNWKTHRGICVEPLGNILIQQGLGREISLKLKRVGVNIFEGGQEKHQQLAKEASLSIGDYGNSPVTLDLSMASDTLATELVRYLLPEEWFWALDSARCHSTIMPDGSIVRTSKFSSMGNAATFPLETLIFYAISRAVTRSTGHSGTVSCYGDDIIVPRGAALLLTEVLRWCGFSVNPVKSFIIGDFYESCGADYLRGVSVRPFYIKRSLRSVPDWFFVCNAARDERYIAFSAPGVHDYVRSRVTIHCRDTLLFGPEICHRKHGIPHGWIEEHSRQYWETRRRGGVLQFRALGERQRFKRISDEPSVLESLRAGGEVGWLGKRRETPKPNATDGIVRFHKYADGAYQKRWFAVP